MKPIVGSVLICTVLVFAILLSGCGGSGDSPRVYKTRTIGERVETPSTVSVTLKGTPAQEFGENGDAHPFHQQVEFINQSNNRVVKTVLMNGDGTASADLPPGDYYIQARDNPDGDLRMLVNITPKAG